jgi:hypothetical protein
MSETLQSPSPIPNLPDWYQFPLLKWRMSLDYQRSLAYLQEDGESRPLLLTKAGAVKLLEPTEPIVSLFPHPLGGFCALSPDTFYLLDQEGAVLKVHTLRERKDKENERVSGYPYEMHFDRGLMIVGYANLTKVKSLPCRESTLAPLTAGPSGLSRSSPRGNIG